MTYTVIASSKAEIELREAFIWYEEIREGLGERFQLDFKEVVLQLQQNPLVYQVRYRQYHVAFMKVFPYGVHFRPMVRLWR